MGERGVNGLCSLIKQVYFQQGSNYFLFVQPTYESLRTYSSYYVILLFIEMFAGFKLFERQYEKHLRIDYIIDPRVNPNKLIYELQHSSSERRNFIKAMTKKTSNGFKLMRRLTVANLLIIYSDQFYELLEEYVDCPLDSSDVWLNEQCIRSYYKFLKKIIASHEHFSVNKIFRSSRTFESLFYLVNLMTEMFKIVSKMPLLGRYFKDANDIVTSSFIECLAVQAQKIYTIIKAIIMDKLSNYWVYLSTKQEEAMMKIILEQSLPFINEQMKKLFLDKYFYPYGKGITIKLFRPEQQSQQTMGLIKGILSDHKDTERRAYQQDLQRTIFPEEGIINMDFVERTLKPVENKNQQAIVKDLDEIEEQEIVPTEFDETTVVEEKVLKETSHHMQICDDV